MFKVQILNQDPKIYRFLLIYRFYTVKSLICYYC